MMQTFTETCPIWSTPASEDGRELRASVYWYDSPRAGGKYQIDGFSKRELQFATLSQRVALTDWLVKQRRSGVECPIIDFKSDGSFIGLPKVSVLERMNSAVISIGSWLRTPGDVFCLGTDFKMIIMDTELFSKSTHYAPYFFAETSSGSPDDDEGILRLLNDAGFIRPKDGAMFESRRDLFMTPLGWQRYAELIDHAATGSQAFVAMWFSPAMDVAYEHGFAPAIRDAGFEPIRIDRKEHNNKIDDEIIAEIRRSKFVVADFTSELVDRHGPDGTTFKDTHARGGVYFEAGFAKGLGKEVIWTVREDLMNAGVLHFDTRQFAHIVWKDTVDLRKRLSQRISATLGDGPNKK